MMPHVASTMTAKASAISRTFRLRRSVERRLWRTDLARHGARTVPSIIQFGVVMSVPGTVEPN
jgi:hypothetical protein